MDNRYYFENIVSNKVVLVGQEAQHLSKVRRCKIGDEIVGFNGDGNDYQLKICNITKQEVEAEIQKTTPNKAMLEKNETTVYLASLKNDALTTAIDHLAELNVKNVKIFKADFSVAVLEQKKLEKLNSIAIQASKQCERADIMHISLIDKKDIIKDAKKLSKCFFAYEDAEDKIMPFSGNFGVVIGPEGGLSKQEVDYFSSFATTISLGKTILRAEVACVASVAALKAVSYEG